MHPTLLLLALLACTRDDGDTIDTSSAEVPDTGDDTQDDTDTEDDTDTNVDTDTDTAEPPVDADGDGVTADLDCDDADPLVFPGADEQCNERDDNCDGTVDEDIVTRDWFIDADGDGWGDASAGAAISDCKAPSGRSDRDGDCNDASAEVHPNATEVCDGIDDDCDGQILDDTDLVAPAADLQAALCADAVKVCTDAGWVEPDYSQITGFEAVEISCDGVDNDCSGAVDDLDQSAEIPLADKQLGVCANSTKQCSGGTFVEPDYTQLADYEADESTCDSVDNDCDGTADDVDLDADGQRPLTCGGLDCDDTNATVGAGFPEDGGTGDYMPTGLDNNCDGFADNGLPYGDAEAGDVVLTGVNYLSDLGGESVDVYGVEVDSRGQRAYRNGEATIPGDWGPGDEVLLLIDSENFVRGSPEEPAPERVGEWWIGTIHSITGGLISFVEEPPELGIYSAQMTRIVQFENLTLEDGATLLGPDRVWLYGGVMPIQVTGTLTLGEEAQISAEGIGYRGGKGAYPPSSSVTTGATGFQGEGRRKLLDKLGSGRRSWIFNDFGGGAGGRFLGYDENNDLVSCQECRCSGGGGGHYLHPQMQKKDFSGDCGDVADGPDEGAPPRNPTPDQRLALGGLHGGSFGSDPSPDLLVFGGGGGGGSAPVAQSGGPGDGGNGGGVLWISARTVVLAEDSMLSVNGERSEDVYAIYGFAGAQPAWGGSGAGGTLWVRTESLTLPVDFGLDGFGYLRAAGGPQNLNFVADPEIWPNFSGLGMGGVITVYTNSFNGDAVVPDVEPDGFQEAGSNLALRRIYPLDEGL